MDYLEIGQVVNTHGIKGEIKIKPFTDDISKFKKFKNINLKQKGQIKEFIVQSVKIINNCVVIKLQGIETLEDANLLRSSIVITKKDYDSLKEGQYYIVDLLGLFVIDYISKEKIGILNDIFNTGSADIYEIKCENGKNILLPAISDFIKQIDIKNKTISVIVPKELL